MINEVKASLEALLTNPSDFSENQIKEIQDKFLHLLNSGLIRSAEKDTNGNWNANIWVKKGILILFKYSKIVDMSINSMFSYFDKDTIPTKSITLEDGIRIVPGGTTIRNGAYVAKGVICMPPSYINIGAYLDEGTMVDSHALVGTCAQVGKRVHLSAASQIGGVLEPAGANPVIVEDDVMIGGNCGIYEGVIIRNRAVLGSGLILNASTKVYDIVNGTILAASANSPLEIPAGAVVVPGSRAVTNEFGIKNGLSIATPLIIKYRDDKTDAKTALESALR